MRRQNVKPRIFYQFLAASTELIQFCYLTMILDTTLGPETHLNIGFKQLWLRKIVSATYSAIENVHFGLIMDVLSHNGLKILLYTFLSKMFNCFLSLFVSVQVSDAHVKVLSIIVFFSLNFSFFDIFLFLKKRLYHKIYFVSIFYSFLPSSNEEQ